jgi:hypothetical protein
LKLVRVPPRFQERFLGKILGGICIASDPSTQPHQSPAFIW